RVLSGAVTAPTPAIGLSPLALNHLVPAGGSLASDVFKVSNTGQGTLDFTVSKNASWLNVTPSGSASSGPERAVSVAYDLASLSVGDYAAAIQISSPNAANAPLILPVSLHLLPPACVWEPFDYYDGNLTTMGAANWSGAASNQ